MSLSTYTEQCSLDAVRREQRLFCHQCDSHTKSKRAGGVLDFFIPMVEAGELPQLLTRPRTLCSSQQGVSTDGGRTLDTLSPRSPSKKHPHPHTYLCNHTAGKERKLPSKPHELVVPQVAPHPDKNNLLPTFEEMQRKAAEERTLSTDDPIMALVHEVEALHYLSGSFNDGDDDINDDFNNNDEETEKTAKEQIARRAMLPGGGGRAKAVEVFVRSTTPPVTSVVVNGEYMHAVTQHLLPMQDRVVRRGAARRGEVNSLEMDDEDLAGASFEMKVVRPSLDDDAGTVDKASRTSNVSKLSSWWRTTMQSVCKRCFPSRVSQRSEAGTCQEGVRQQHASDSSKPVKSDNGTKISKTKPFGKDDKSGTERSEEKPTLEKAPRSSRKSQQTQKDKKAQTKRHPQHQESKKAVVAMPSNFTNYSDRNLATREAAKSSIIFPRTRTSTLDHVAAVSCQMRVNDCTTDNCFAASHSWQTAHSYF